MKITVGGTATLLAAADANRETLCVQHIDVTHDAARVWLGGASVAVGDGLLLLQAGLAITITGSAARQAWYALAAETVDVAVVTSSRWDSRAQ